MQSEKHIILIVKMIIKMIASVAWRHPDTFSRNSNVRFTKMLEPKPSVVFFESAPDQWRWIVRTKNGRAVARCVGYFPSMERAQAGYWFFLQLVRDPKQNKVEDAA